MSKKNKRGGKKQPALEDLVWNENPIVEPQITEQVHTEEIDPLAEQIEAQLEEEEQQIEEDEQPLEEEQQQLDEEQPLEEEEPLEEQPLEELNSEEPYVESIPVTEEEVIVNITTEEEEREQSLPGTPIEEHSIANNADEDGYENDLTESVEEISCCDELIEQIPNEEYPDNIDTISTSLDTTQISVHNSPVLSRKATPATSKAPSRQPTPVPSQAPSVHSSPAISKAPSRQPTPIPTPAPSVHSTPIPSHAPSRQPTPATSKAPSRQPTPATSKATSKASSRQPTPASSQAPSLHNTPVPSQAPSKAPTPVVSRKATPAPSQAPSRPTTPQRSIQHSPVSRTSISKKSMSKVSEILQAELMLAKNSNNKLIKENGIDTSSKKEDIMSELELPPVTEEIKSTIAENNKQVLFNKMTDYFSNGLNIGKSIEEENPEDVEREAAELQTKMAYDPNTMGTIRKRRVDRQLLANDLSSELPISLRYNENIHIDNEAEIENYKDEWTLWVEDGLDKLDELIMLLDELENKYNGSGRRNRYTANAIQFLNLLLGSGIVYVQSSTTNAELIRDWNTVAGGLATLSTMVYNYFGFAKKATHYSVVASNINILNCWVKSKLVLPVDKRFSPYDIYIIATKALQTILEEANQKKNDSK